MTHKGVANSVLNFGGILFTPIGNIAVFWCPPSTSYTPLNTLILISTHSNCAVISVSNGSSLWVEISTLAYESKSSCCPKWLSVAYCTHIIQTKLMLKNRIYAQKSMFSATGVPTDVPLVVLG